MKGMRCLKTQSHSGMTAVIQRLNGLKFSLQYLGWDIYRVMSWGVFELSFS